MNVEELLDMLEETLEEGTAVPFAAAKRVVETILPVAGSNRYSR